MLPEWFYTALSTVTSGVAVVFGSFALREAVRCRRRWSDSAAARKIDLLRSEVADLRELYEHQAKLYRRLTARQRKRDEAEEGKQDIPEPPEPVPGRVPGEPDPFRQPDEWKTWKRQQMKL